MRWVNFVAARVQKSEKPVTGLQVPWKCQICGWARGFYIAVMDTVHSQEFSEADYMRNFCYCPKHKPKSMRY
jgi:hypothetical protein